MLTQLLKRIFKWLLLISLLILAATFVPKDRLPAPEHYDLASLNEPIQSPATAPPFSLQVQDQEYTIEPVNTYELQGVVVSYHDADSFTDIWHHRKWKDFLNVRDLCVIWGKNVATGVYQAMDFDNDSWTCWAYWPDAATGARFSMNQLSNNHLLTEDREIKQRLMSAETGDHIRLRGLLASYANTANNFHRGTSTTRTDTGNGACETIYLQDFEIVSKAHNRARRLFHFAKWSAGISLAGFLTMFFLSPIKRR